MSPDQQRVLRAALERTTDDYFAKRSKLVILTNKAPSIDATGILVVLAQWAGDLIKGAPPEMQDQLFLNFADSVATLAGIKAKPEEGEPAETLQ